MSVESANIETACTAAQDVKNDTPACAEPVQKLALEPSLGPVDEHGAPMWPVSDHEIMGLWIWPRYISAEHEALVLKWIETSAVLNPITTRTGSRRVAQYGYRYDYNKAMMPVAIEPLPEIARSLVLHPEMIKRIAGRADARGFDFNQLIINEYLPGQGISPHVDHPQQFGPVVFCISLGSGTNIEFTMPGTGGRVVNRYMHPGSAYVLTGPARSMWRHGITAKKSDNVFGTRVPRGTRYSLTYRTVQ